MSDSRFDEKKLRPYLTAERIRALTEDLGKRIDADYAKLLGTGEELLAVVTLKGAMFFAADLLRYITAPVRIDFVRLASYGAGTKSSGGVRILKDLETPAEGRHVLIIDEIVDSGRTIHFLNARLHEERPKTVRVCTLLDKPSRREVDVNVDYIGTTVEDKFLVGYGLDFAENYRNLPDIRYLADT